MECEEVFSYAVERKLPEASVCDQKEAAEGLYVVQANAHLHAVRLDYGEKADFLAMVDW